MVGYARKFAIVIGDGEHLESITPKLVNAGWNVLLAGADKARLDRIATDVNAAGKAQSVTVYELHLSSLASIREFATYVVINFDGWDALLNSGSVRVVPERRLTDDGFEWQLGVNYLGPYALAGLISSSANPQARLVSVASLTYMRVRRMRFHDLRWDHKYRAARAHAISKLAILMFTAELAGRASNTGLPELSPGFEAVAVYPGNARGESHPQSRQIAAKVFYQSPDHAAEMIAFAVTGEQVFNGAFVVPDGPGNLYGKPKTVQLPQIALNPVDNLRLWRVSSQLTRVHW